MKSWVNGRPGTAIDCHDRGLQYGDGLFETMRVRGRGIRLLEMHLERLAAGCARLGMPSPNAGRLRRELEAVAALRSEAVLKLIVTRGVGPRGYRPGGRERGTRVLTLHSLPRSVLRTAGHAARIRLCNARLGQNVLLAGMKTLNRLESVLARSEWSDVNVWEGLMRDTDDNIVCGTRSNLFVRRGSSLMTPLLDRCGVAGVMRRWVLAQAGALGLHAVEARLRWEDLARMDEVFMTNAVVGVVPIALIRHGRVTLRPAEQHVGLLLCERLARL